MPRSAVVRVLVIAAVLVAARPRAEACSDPHAITSRMVLPPNGSSGVPTNARILVEYRVLGDWFFLDGFSSANVELRGPGETTVPTSVIETWAGPFVITLLTPAEPLDPDTVYEVHDSTLVPCGDAQPNASCGGTPVLVATFTTGDGPDTQPPTSSWSVSSSYGQEEEVEGAGCSCDWCGNWVRHDLTLVAVADDQPTALVRYFYGDALVGPLPVLSAGHDCGDEPYHPGYDIESASDTVTLRAVDLAGNVEAVAHVLIGSSCDELRPEAMIDAGVPEPDASASNPDAGSGAADAGAGCCSTGGDPAAALALLALGLRRRRGL